MELIVLGAGGGWPAAGGAASGYLLRHQGFNMWVDLGTGSMANLQEHIELGDVHSLAISHRHFDHFLDLYPFFLARYYPKHTPDPPRLPLFAPPGMFDHALQLEADLPGVFEPHTVELGETFHAGPFTVRTAPMRHPVPTLGMRFEADGSVFAYSADTGPTDELVSLADGADALLCEATWLKVPPTAPDPFHLIPSEAGGFARRAGVGRLIITHVWPTNDMDSVVGQAAEAFGDQVTLAREGLKVEW